MRTETHGSNVYLVNNEGVLHVAGTLYLNQEYTNPHTKAVVARALRVWARVATAFDIDLATRALKGQWLNEAEKKALRYLVFRPITEIELMQDQAVRHIALATKGAKAKEEIGAVEPNTAHKQLVGIANFLTWFHRKILEPRMPVASLISTSLRRQVEDCARDLKKGVAGTSTSHPHRISSVPNERFLQLYSAVYLNYRDVFRTDGGKPASNAARDRAIVLLACEGLRPGAIGNLARADFRWEGINLPGYIALRDNTARRATPVGTNTPVQKGTSSNQNYNSEVTVPVWPTTAKAIQEYIEGERSENTSRGLQNRSKGFLFVADHGGPIGDRGTIARVFRQAGKGLADAGLLSRDLKDPYLDGESYDFHAYLLRHSAASLFFATKSHDMKSEVVMDLMKCRFGWSRASAMPALYAQRAMSDAASVTVNDFVETLFAQARAAKSTNTAPHEHG